MHTENPFNNIMDTAAVAAAIGSISNVLPPIAALLAIIWTAIRIYEWVRFRILKQSDKELFK
jgi:glycerol-3-phosphate acyltransferase PlsY